MGGTPNQTEATLGRELERIHEAAHNKNAAAREARPAGRDFGPNKKRTQRGQARPQAGAPMSAHVLVKQATEAAKTVAAEVAAAESLAFDERLKATEKRLQHLYDKQVLQQLGSIRAMALATSQDMRDLAVKIDGDTEVADLAASVSSSLSELENQISGLEKEILVVPKTEPAPREFGMWFLKAALA